MARPIIDWGAGEYETTAADLQPVSERVVALAAPLHGVRLLDVATGTGNAALVAARAGAIVTGLDASPRLIAVARERAATEGLSIDFEVGDAEALPYRDGSFDVAVSVFGLIFAADPQRAVGELLRILRPGGRALLTAWVPEGPIDEMLTVIRRGVVEATGTSPATSPWDEPDVITGLVHEVEPRARVRFEHAEVTIERSSPEAYLDGIEHHPMGLATRPALERGGNLDRVLTEMLLVLSAGNEDVDGFRVRSPYRIVEIRRPG